MPILFACPACNSKVSDQAQTCPSCGHPLANDDFFQARAAKIRRGPPLHDRIAHFIGVSFVVVFVIYYALNATGGSDHSPTYPETTKAKPVARATTRNTSVDDAEGKALWEDLMSQHPELDPFYKRPVLWGALSPRPLTVIHVVKDDWERLSNEQKTALERYAGTQVKVVQSAPLKHCNVRTSNLNLAMSVTSKAQSMSDRHWGIMVGKITPDGRDITADKIIRSGMQQR